MKALSRTLHPVPTPPRPSWLLALLWTAFAACVVAMAATFAWPPGPGAGWNPVSGAAGEPDNDALTRDGGLVQVAPLPAAVTPAARFDPTTAWHDHPDLPQLAHGDAGLLRDLGFHAWHAAQIAAPSDPIGVRPLQSDATDLAQEDALRQRVAAWDALAPAERSARRESWQAWQHLSAADRAAVEDAAAVFRALPQERQRELRLQFEGLSLDEQRGWWLGPTLGLAWPRLQPLLMQVPEPQREPLLAILHRLSPRQLDDLAILAQRTPPQSRAALRQELMATSDANRAVWLQSRVND